jgi:glutamate-ammonia-ligase adenylyltransferase
VKRHGALAPMTVLALGKHGGRELGYASDLDLVFVYDGNLDDPEIMTKLAQRLVHALGAVLEEGRLYAVDTRLRPSGQKGTLVSSLGAWRAYHASKAALWERQALIKARAVAGDAALGRLLEREIEAHVYEGPRAVPHAVAQAMRAMRERMERELAHERGGTYDIKTGRGGIVDVEFAAQYLQLVHGPDVPILRVRATVDALERAQAAGVLAEATAAALVGGYRFLRRLEHRMRIVHDRPTHELPSDPVELDKLARRTGMPSAPALERAYLTFTREVRTCYLKLLEAA